MGEIRLEQEQTTAQLQAQKVSLSYCVCVYTEATISTEYSKHWDLF